MAGIPENYIDLTKKKAFAQLATLMPDGSPHVARLVRVRWQERSDQFRQGASERQEHPA